MNIRGEMLEIAVTASTCKDVEHNTTNNKGNTHQKIFKHQLVQQQKDQVELVEQVQQVQPQTHCRTYCLKKHVDRGCFRGTTGPHQQDRSFVVVKPTHDKLTSCGIQGRDQ